MTTEDEGYGDGDGGGPAAQPVRVGQSAFFHLEDHPDGHQEGSRRFFLEDAAGDQKSLGSRPPRMARKLDSSGVAGETEEEEAAE